MVMEFADGVPLSELLAERTLSLSETIRFSIHILDALQHAHENGIMHRDLKPANIMVSEEETKVLDFGMAAIEDVSTDDIRITRDGAIYGTPPYMSPEQCRGKKDVDLRTDLYSFGVILFEMIDGVLPFDSHSVLDILLMHTNEEPPELSSDVPPRLKEIVKQLLAKSPSERIQSAVEVRKALEQLDAALPVARRDSATIVDGYPGLSEAELETTKTNSSFLRSIFSAFALVIFAVIAFLVLSHEPANRFEADAFPPIEQSVEKIDKNEPSPQPSETDTVAIALPGQKTDRRY